MFIFAPTLKTYAMKYLLLLIFPFVFAGCHLSNPLQERLERAETYMEDHPDSALSLLQQISADDCRGKKQKAYYNLLLTQALDKTYSPIADAPIASALAFYKDSNDSLRKAKAFFYQGRQYQENKEYEAATRCFLRALTAGKPLKIPKYEALCYSYLGHVNSVQGLYENSLEQYKRAADTFEEMGDSLNYAITLLDVGYGFLFLTKLDSAVYYTKRGLHIAELLNDEEEKQAALRNLGILYSQKKEYQKALDIFLAIKDEMVEEDYSFYASLIDIYIHLKEYDVAECYAESIIRNDSDLYGKATGYLSLYKVAKERKDWKKALSWREQYDLYADSIYEQVKTVKLEEIQMKYDNQELAHEKELLAISKQHNEWILESIILLVVVLLLFGIYIYRKEKDSKEQHILLLQHQIQENENSLLILQRDYIQRNKEIEELSLQYERDSKTLSVENEQVRQQLLELQQQNKEENVKLADKNMALLHELKKYKDIKTESGRYYETITFIINLLDNPDAVRVLTSEELDAIESFVVRLFGPLFQSRVQSVGLSATERKLWCLLQLGFSHSSIATFLCITPQSVSKAKFRMKKKIQEFMANDIEKLYL